MYIIFIFLKFLLELIFFRKNLKLPVSFFEFLFNSLFLPKKRHFSDFYFFLFFDFLPNKF